MKYQLVIFDLDGTLVDTIADLGAAVNKALARYNLPTHTLDEYRAMVGHGVRSLCQLAMPEQLRDDEQLLDGILAEFMLYYRAHIVDHSRAYDGMLDLVQELKAAGVKMAVASNKFEEGTLSIVSELFPEGSFGLICGAREGLPLKPDAAVVDYILGQLGGSKESTVLVGDSGTDAKTAAAAGIASIGVAWGFKPEQAREQCGLFAQTPAELRGLLL